MSLIILESYDLYINILLSFIFHKKVFHRTNSNMSLIILDYSNMIYLRKSKICFHNLLEAIKYYFIMLIVCYNQLIYEASQL